MSALDKAKQGLQEPLLRKMTDVLGLEVPESMVYFVYLTTFIDILAACISTPVMPYYAQSFGAPVEWIGYLYGAWSFSATVFAPMLGGMSDRWGRKTVLVMCLCGAGTANVIQGTSLYLNTLFPVLKPGFCVFFFGRAFSGVWASIGATCNVYISDVAPAKTVREKFLEKMPIVISTAVLFGPGLGGGLAAAYGNNAPVLVDGIITLFGACFVYRNLVETPAFLRKKEEEAAKQAPGQEAVAEQGQVGKQQKDEATLIPKLVHVFGFSSFLTAFGGQISLSMNALFYQKIHGFSTLYIGFIFMGMAVCMLLSNMVLLPFFKGKLGMSPLSLVLMGGSIQAITSLLFSLEGSYWWSLGCQYTGTAFSSVGSSQISSIISTFTDVSNRGKIFGLMQTYQNLGKIVGPILGTHVAMSGIFGIGMQPGLIHDLIAKYTDEGGKQHPFGLPYVIISVLYFTAQIFVLIVATQRREPSKVEPAGIKRADTLYGEQWSDETYTDDDVKRLGAFMAELLTMKHYKWVSQKEAVEDMLTELLPSLEVTDKESYHHSFEMAQHRTSPSSA